MNRPIYFRNRLTIILALIGIQGLRLATEAGAAIPNQLEWTYPQWSWSEARAFAITADDQGYTYVAGVFIGSDPEGPFMRFIQKYDPNGQRVPHPEAVGSLEMDPVYWFFAVSWESDYSGIFWQDLVLDSTRNRLYVLFAVQLPGATEYDYFLQAHDSQTGETVWDFSKHVGDSPTLRAGLDVDRDGNVWTVTQPVLPLPSGYGSGLSVKKWNLSDGSEVSVPYLGTMATPGRDLVFQAFGASKTQARLHIAYRKEAQGVPTELVVTAHDLDLQLLGSTSSSVELTVPDLPGYSNLGNPVQHVVIDDGFVDSQDRFIVAGYYRFEELLSSLDYVYGWMFHPTVIAYNSDLTVAYEYKELEQPYFYTGSLDFLQVYSVPTIISANESRNGSVHYSFRSTHWIYEVDASGVRTDYKILPHPSITLPVLYQDCVYLDIFLIPSDFVSIGDQRLVSTGSLLFVPTSDTLSYCYDETTINWFNTTSYDRPLLQFAPSPRGRFEWMELPPGLLEFLRNYGIPGFGTGGGGDPPCPRCLPSFSRYRAGNPLSRDKRNVFQKIRPYISALDGKGELDFGDRYADELRGLVHELPETPLFSAELKASLTDSVATMGRGRTAYREAGPRVVEALNALDLEARLPYGVNEIRGSAERQTTEKQRVSFGGLLWLETSSSDLRERILRDCTLNVDSGAPRSAEGVRPLWPAATYRFDCQERQRALMAKDGPPLKISVHLGGMEFGPGQKRPVLLQWEGGSYRNITTEVDLNNNLIFGETNELSSFVIFNVERATRPSK